MKKLHRLSSEFLKLMVTEYHNNSDMDVFSFDFFKEKYPDLSDDQISNALYLLKNDGLVSVLSADDVAYETVLNPSAIVAVEEDTLIKRGYELIKEIKSLIS